MIKITHAYIKYADNKKCVTVPIRDVKLKRDSDSHITPRSEEDFEKRKYYYVKWSDCDDDCQEDHVHFGFYPAFILLLGVSAQDIETKVEKGSRLITPCGVQSSGSEENVKPTGNQRHEKHPTLVQNVQKKKNLDVLNKHKATILLSSRKRFDGDSDERDDEQEKNDVDGEKSDGQENANDHDVTENEDLADANDELEKRLQNKSAEVQELRQAVKFENQNRSREKNKVEGNSKIRVRRNLFNQDDDQMDDGNPLPLEQRNRGNDEISNDADDVGCSSSLGEYRRKSTPEIIHNKRVKLNLDVYKSSRVADDLDKRKGDQQAEKGGSNNVNINDGDRKTKMVQIPQPKMSSQKTQGYPKQSSSGGSREKLVGNVDTGENQNAPLQDDENEVIGAGDNDGPNEDQQRVRQRLPPKAKRRRIEPTGTGLKGNTAREIEAMIQYYESEEGIQDVERMYQVVGKKIYLGEGVEVSAALWFLLQQKKPSLFFRDMIEFIWPPQKLVNRCLTIDKITTKLLGRSPMKELTPRKKRLAYKLYSDYLDTKRIKDTEKMRFLSKVPASLTSKIHYLRNQYYE